MSITPFTIGSCHFFSAPQSSNDNQLPTPGHLAVLLDASASMGQWWASVATMTNSLMETFGARNTTLVTFDDYAYVSSPAFVSQDQKIHGGRCTDIANGFHQMSICLESLPRGTPTVLLFISDGCDNSGNKSSNCARIVRLAGERMWPENFSVVCCGVGTGFPTALSMGIREVLHRGDRAAAPLVVAQNIEDLIQVSDELRTLLRPCVALQVDPPVFSLPWDVEPRATVSTNALVFWKKTPIEVPLINEVPYPELLLPSHVSFISSEILMRLVRGWTSALQLESLRLSSAEVKNHSMIALELIRCLRQELATTTTTTTTTTMLTRVQAKQARTDQYAWCAFECEIRKLAEGDLLSNLSDIDRAQRLRIGTMDGGKYQNNALKKGAITDDQFERMRREFLQLFEKHPLTADMPCSQEPSLMTLCNTCEALCEDGISEAIKLCDTQYALVENFPLIGMALELATPSDGALINPYLAIVSNVPRVAKVYDSQSLVIHAGLRGNGSELTTPLDREAFSECTIDIPIGNGQVEKVNAVLPLFNLPVDEVLRPYASSDLYRLMVHFQFMHNVDTYDPFTYLGALATLYVHLAQLPSTTWRNDRLRSVCQTTNMVYGANRAISAYVGALASGEAIKFRAALVSDHPNNQVGDVNLRCEHLTKPLLLMSPMCGFGITVPSRTLGMHLLFEFFGRAYGLHVKHSNESISAFFESTENLQTQITQAVDDIANRLISQDFETLHMLTEAAIAQAKDVTLCSEWLPRFTKIRALRLHGLGLTEIFDTLSVNGWPADLIDELKGDQCMLPSFYLATLESNSYERSQSIEAHTTMEDPWRAFQLISAKIQNALNSCCIADFRSSYASTLHAPLVHAYQERMNSMHCHTLPLTRREIEHQCILIGVDHMTVKRSRAGLSSNTCFCDQCPFFMKPSCHFATHLHDIYANEPVVAYHVTIMAERQFGLDVSQVYNRFLDGVYMTKTDDAQPRNVSSEERIMQDNAAYEINAVNAKYAQWTPAEFAELEADCS
jgi:hypothetical protein